jgi:hypothetical protein
MLLSCVVFSDTSTVPDRVAHYIKAQTHLVEKGVFSRMDALEKELSSKSIDYLLVDSTTVGNSLPGLIARFADSIRIVLVDENGLYAVQSVSGIDLDDSTDRSKRKGASGIGGNIQVELEGPVLQRLRQQLDAGQSSVKIALQGAGQESAQRDAIYVRHESRIIRIPLQDLGFVEAQKDYVILNTSQSEHKILGSMKRIVAELGEQDYYRVHRSFIVRLDRIDRIEGEDLYLSGFEKPVPIGPSYRSQLLKTLRLL